MDKETFALLFNYGVPTALLLLACLGVWRACDFIAPLIRQLANAVVEYINSQRAQGELQTNLMEQHQRSLESADRKLDELLLMSRQHPST